MSNRKYDPIVRTLVTLANGKIIVSFARKSFAEKRGLRLANKLAENNFPALQSSNQGEPIRKNEIFDNGQYSHCQAKSKKRPSNLRKLFRKISAQIEHEREMYEEVTRILL